MDIDEEREKWLSERPDAKDYTPEWLDWRLRDPDRIAKLEAERAVRAAADLLRLAEEEPLAKELQAAGFPVDSAWDLYKHKPYPAAIPILLDHLQRDYADKTLHGIGFALAVPEAAYAWNQLVTAFRRAKNQAAGGIANALIELVSRETMQDLIDLIYDDSLSDARIILLGGLRKAPRKDSWLILENLKSHPVLGLQATESLKRRKRPPGI